MIKEIENIELVTISVELLDGTKYERCDTVSNPWSAQGVRAISIWVDGDLCIFPLETVRKVTIHTDK